MHEELYEEKRKMAGATHMAKENMARRRAALNNPRSR